MMSPMNLSQYYWGHWWLRGTCYYDPMAEYMDYMNQMREYEEELNHDVIEIPLEWWNAPYKAESEG